LKIAETKEPMVIVIEIAKRGMPPRAIVVKIAKS
jgi:hypothetical protein